MCSPAPTPGPLVSYADVAAAVQNDAANAQYNVLTQHNDNARAGAATHETTLTPAAVKNGFGLLGRVPIDGKLYAQPLYVEQAAVSCGGGPVSNRNIAYVATLANVVYAIDVDTRAVCWSTPTLGCGQNGDGLLGFNPEQREGPGAVTVGIVSTPVIDLARSVLFAVSREADAAGIHFFLNTLDTRTGALVGRAEVTGGGAGDCGGQAFVPASHNNRAGLVLVDNKVFLAFASTIGEDASTPYHGWVIGFDVSDPAAPTSLPHAFCSTPTQHGAGVWMSGAGLASDGAAVYFMTGNGAYTLAADGSYVGVPQAPPAGNYPNSFVRVPLGFFQNGLSGVTANTDLDPPSLLPTPAAVPNQPTTIPSPAYRFTTSTDTIFHAREYSDADLGSGGVALFGNLVMGGGKDGFMYLLDAANMAARRDRFQAFVDADNNLGTDNSYAKQWDYRGQYYSGPNIHGAPVVWDVTARGGSTSAFVYAWSEKDALKRFQIQGGHFNPAPNATPWNPTPSPHGEVMSTFRSMAGAMLSLSANGSGGGIVWALVEEPYPTVTGVAANGRCGDGYATSEACAGCMVGPAFDKFVEHCDASQGYVSGRLYAFAADDNGRGLLPLLWGDKRTPVGTTPNNAVTRYSKFTPPTVAHGKLLVPTANGELLIYGLTTPKPRPRQPDDLMSVWNEGGLASFALYRSTPSASYFEAPSVWATQDGGFNGSYMAGDYDGDGRDDVVGAWSNSYYFTPPVNGLAVRRSTGNAAFPFETTSEWAGYLASGTWYRRGDRDFAWQDGAPWVTGDFDGDGRSDAAVIWNQAGYASMRVYRAASNGTRFEQGFPWSKQDGGFIPSPSASWLAGDFNGDGLDDLVAIWNDAGFNTASVRLSNRSAFAAASSPWLLRTDPYLSNARWLAGDFDGDGLADIASATPSGTNTRITLYRSTGTGFSRVWQSGLDGGWGDDVKWAAGDFDADGKTDIASVWNNGAQNALVLRRSAGIGFFAATGWMKPGANYGAWGNSTVWVAGKYHR